MKKSNIVVIGGGLAGLTAAATAAKNGYKVTLLAKGVGALAVGSGAIDILGYFEGQPVKQFREVLPELNSAHPYVIAGYEGVREAMDFFLNLCAEQNYPLHGTLESNNWLPTVAGTLKPSGFVPKTMNPNGIEQADRVTIISFIGLKDFYPQMIIKGLNKLVGYKKQYRTVTIDPGFSGGRDVNALDIARWLDTKEGQAKFAAQLQAAVPAGTWILMPPVLGTEPNYELWSSLERRLACRMVEMVAPPPGITGTRLWRMLIRCLKQNGVRIIEQANVQQAECRNGRCLTVATRQLGREKIYEADAFILATGGFLGGGLIAEPAKIYEPIFGLPVQSAGFKAENISAQLFNYLGHEFARSGVLVDSKLRPSLSGGETCLENVYLAGNILAGYDYCSEKSGNGVAIVTGYQAAISAIRSVR